MCKVASEGLSSSLPVPSEALVVVSFYAREIPGEFSWTVTPRGVHRAMFSPPEISSSLDHIVTIMSVVAYYIERSFMWNENLRLNIGLTTDGM